MGDNRPDDQIPLDDRTTREPKNPRPPVNYKTRPATPRLPDYHPGSASLQDTPLTSTAPVQQSRGMGVGGYTLLILGGLVFLLATIGMFSAATIFGNIFGAVFMVMGVVLVTGGVVIVALR